MEPFAAFVTMRTEPDDVARLAEALGRAAATVAADPACRLYLVATVPDDPTAVTVTEVWDSQEAHDAALAEPAVAAIVREAVPLLAGRPTSVVLHPVAGVPTAGPAR